MTKEQINNEPHLATIQARIQVLNACDPLDTWEEMKTLEARQKELLEFKEACDRG